MRIIILLCFLAMLSSLVGFFLDIVGPTRKIFKIIRRNAIPSIFTGNDYTYLPLSINLSYFLYYNFNLILFLIRFSYNKKFIIVTLTGRLRFILTSCTSSNIFGRNISPMFLDHLRNVNTCKFWENIWDCISTWLIVLICNVTKYALNIILRI